MQLEKKVKMIIGAAILTVVAGTNGIIYGRNHFHIGRNLEPNAILCNSCTNLRPIVGMNLPLFKNKDLDGNGKYESALFYKNSQGRTVYQEITKNEDDRLIISEPKFYE